MNALNHSEVKSFLADKGYEVTDSEVLTPAELRDFAFALAMANVPATDIPVAMTYPSEKVLAVMGAEPANAQVASDNGKGSDETVSNQVASGDEDSDELIAGFLDDVDPEEVETAESSESGDTEEHS